MRTKIGLGLLIVSLLIMVHFINENSEGSKTNNYQKASFSFTKCTPTKFMLDAVDTTQQNLTTRQAMPDNRDKISGKKI